MKLKKYLCPLLVILCLAEAVLLGIAWNRLSWADQAAITDRSVLTTPDYSEPLPETVWSEEKVPFTSDDAYLELEALFMAFQPEDVDLVFLGDSITFKFEWQDAFPAWRVANRGIGHDTCERVLSRLDSIVPLNPKVISLLVGINDLLYSNFAHKKF